MFSDHKEMKLIHMPLDLMEKILELLDPSDINSLAACNTSLFEMLGSTENMKILYTQIQASKSIPGALKLKLLDSINKVGIKKNTFLKELFNPRFLELDDKFSRAVFKEAAKNHFFHLQALIMFSLGSWDAYKRHSPIDINSYNEMDYINLAHFLEKNSDFTHKINFLNFPRFEVSKVFEIHSQVCTNLITALHSERKSSVRLYETDALFRIYHVLNHYLRYQNTNRTRLSYVDWLVNSDCFLKKLLSIRKTSSNRQLIQLSERLICSIFASYLTYYYLEGHGIKLFDKLYSKNPQIQIIVKDLMNIYTGKLPLSTLAKLHLQLSKIIESNEIFKDCLITNIYHTVSGSDLLHSWVPLVTKEEKVAQFGFADTQESFLSWTKAWTLNTIKKIVEKDFLSSEDEMDQLIGNQLLVMFEKLEKLEKVTHFVDKTFIKNYRDAILNAKTDINTIKVLIADSDNLNKEKWINGLHNISTFMSKVLLDSFQGKKIELKKEKCEQKKIALCMTKIDSKEEPLERISTTHSNEMIKEQVVAETTKQVRCANK